jgi:hypothetical protein
MDCTRIIFLLELQCEWYKHELIKLEKEFKKDEINAEVPLLHPLTELGYYIPSSIIESGSGSCTGSEPRKSQLTSYAVRVRLLNSVL